ncbi:Protein Wnt [Meloidogyne graminicola]|uniref:Protein Wnt n=1 Tax=Meloidogyne graminicola TaxID=189291 RepID=A0A8S9ZV47_9BILA|nr:Protein Wnt [Meloidogyne graminicola]
MPIDLLFFLKWLKIAKACSSGQLANCPCGIGDTVTTNAIDPTAKNLLQHNLTELSYKWKGCSDNVVQGRRISREWSDSKWRPNLEEAINEIATRNNWNIVNTEAIGEGSDDYIEDDHMRKILKLKRHSPGSKRNGQKARMNEFNNEIGRQVVEQSLYKKCLQPGASLKRWKGKGPDSDDEIQSLVKVEMGY